MLHEIRDPDCRNAGNTGYYPGGTYIYAKHFEAQEAWRGSRVSVLFEGVYHRSRVRLNGTELHYQASGYSQFTVNLDGLRYGEDNLIEVIADTSEEPNSRWYSGSGIYRPVWLQIEPQVRLADDGVRFRTLKLDHTATASVMLELTQSGDGNTAAINAVITLLDNAEPVASARALLASGQSFEVKLDVSDYMTWSPADPHLYELSVRLQDPSGACIEERRFRVGLRILEVDAKNGLRLNGEPLLLRGACIHHDHGVLGAATFAAAELRRARLLKEQGFNSVRSSHNPASSAFLAACDELGLLVIDELTDVWYVPKTAHDYHLDFTEWWKPDLEAMVAKCRNHPSVIMYSLGNENSETSSIQGIALTAKMAEVCRILDPDRLVTTGVNLMLNGLATLGIGVFKPEKDKSNRPADMASSRKKRGGTSFGSAFFNMMVGRVGPAMGAAGRLRRVDRATEGVFSKLDVAGYNYGDRAYRVSGKRHPDRVIVGSETMPGNVARNWKQIQDLPYLIGDFMWTGWDYLGEAGLAGWSYDDAPKGAHKPFPYLTSGGGALDLLGDPSPMMHHARAAWGLADRPAICVRPLDLVHRRAFRSPWRPTDAVASWTWPGFEGIATEVLVYSDAAEVELRLNGRTLGRKRAGITNNCVAKFKVQYEPGILVAIARGADGAVLSSNCLSTAGEPHGLVLRADRDRLSCSGQDLAFVEISLVDVEGTVLPVSGMPLSAHVSGAGSLAGLGSADPAPTTRFVDRQTQLYRGRALAIVRADDTPGEVSLTISSDEYESSLLVQVG
jgi:beta-galactosidase